MKLTEKTIKEFADKGISVRWYPERTKEEFEARCWRENYQSYIDYYKNHVAGCESVLAGHTNVIFQSMDELKANAKQSADYSGVGYRNDCYNSTALYIEYSGRLIIQKVNVKSKEITAEYVCKLIEKDKKAYNGYYGKFAEKMNAILTANGMRNFFSVYPTTYGIGVWVIYNYHAKNDIGKVTGILDKYGVEYSNEYSEAGWVYRFKVSKKAANINKLTA